MLVFLFVFDIVVTGYRAAVAKATRVCWVDGVGIIGFETGGSKG